MIWIAILAVLLLLAAAPFVFEALRRPMNAASRAGAPGQFAELSRGTTHYQWHGPKSDRILVMVHGLTTPSWVFSGLIRGLLMMRYRILTYDLYGRGYSDRPMDHQTLALHADQLAELIDAAGIRVPVTLLGYSMGGAIATLFTADEPDRVERLILLAPTGIRYSPSPLLTTARIWGKAGDWLWGLLGGAYLRRNAARDAKAPTVIPDLTDRIALEVDTRGYLRSVLSSERHALSETLEKEHREIAAMYIPTLAIWAENDALIPVAAVGELARWNRQVRQEVIPGATHSLAYTAPKEVLAAIRDFLREVPE